MSISISSKKVYLDIDEDSNIKSTISFNILKQDILFDLDIHALKSTNSLITYFIDDKRWGVFTEDFWHILPENFIHSYIIAMYKNILPKGVQFIYEC